MGVPNSIINIFKTIIAMALFVLNVGIWYSLKVDRLDMTVYFSLTAILFNSMMTSVLLLETFKKK